MADYQYGFNCIVAKVKGSQELDLEFVLNRKQYTVTYRENKGFDGGRNLSELLLASDALKASIWNVPTGPPGSKTRSWYVTDIWNPNIAGMEKSRLPEPTISIVCKITHLLGKDFFLCELGRHFTKDIIVLPRNLVHSVVKNSSPEVGDYLLVFSVIVWEVLDGSKISRFVPLWAYWDSSNCAQASTAHLNIVERGPENSTLIIPDQIPSMWGVVQSVTKKRLKVYVPCIASSVSVPGIAIYQCDSEILAEDWLQLWLTPQQVNGRINNRFSNVSNWTCSSCCWFGRAKRRYEAYLQQRLNGHYMKHSSPPVVDSGAPQVVPPAAAVTAKIREPKPAQQAPAKLDPDAGPIEIGVGTVLEVREKSGVLRCKKVGCQRDHVFHMGLMTIYGVKMARIPSAKMTDLVKKGSELRYRMNPVNHHLRAVWIGPEIVTFKHLNFLPQLHEWFGKRNLSGVVMQEMVNCMIDNFEAMSNTCAEIKAKGETPKEVGPVASGVCEGKRTAKVAVVVRGNKGAMVPPRGSADGRDDDDRNAGFEGAKNLEEDEEKLMWSDHSGETEDSDEELKPMLTPEGGLLPDNEDNNQEEVGRGSDDLIVFDELRHPQEKVNGQWDVASLSRQPVVPKAGAEPGIECRGLDSEKIKKKKTSMLMAVLVELTKFLVEKGKSETVADACEISAEFVARLEKALEGTTDDDPLVARPLTQSVGLQTEISGPISPVRDPLSVTHFSSFM